MNTVANVQTMLARDYPYDVKLVEHHEKPGLNQRLSLLVYGEQNGLAVVTLERSEAWGISDVKTNNHWHKVLWPNDSKLPPTAEGAEGLVKSIMESISAFDKQRVK